MTLDDIKTIAEIVALIVGLPTVVIRGWRSWDKRFTRLESDMRLINLRTQRIEAQFGDNGGGLREAVNAQGKLLERVDSRSIETLERVAALEGRHEQKV